MIYPLYLINHDQPENRDLMNRTVEHWLAAGEGIYIIPLKKGDEVVLTTEPATPVVSPVEADRSSWNAWGLKKDTEVL